MPNQTLEPIQEEFRRRTKTQASLPSEDAVLLMLFGLVRSVQLALRRTVGWQEMAALAHRSNATEPLRHHH